MKHEDGAVLRASNADSMRALPCLALAFWVFSITPARAQTSAPAAASLIAAAYSKLAQAYENADEALLRALLTSNFTFEYVIGTSEGVSQYVSDWKQTRQNSPGIHVTMRILSIDVRSDIADTTIQLTQTYPRGAHMVVDVQQEHDHWVLRANTWALARAETIKDTVSVDGAVVSRDGPANPLSARQMDAVAAELRQAAWPIETAVPGGPLRELDPLYGAIESARIVAMGEATHGTSEFFSLKDRIFRFLVEKMGFTVFAIEAPWRSALIIDRYVTTGQGNPRAALAGTFAVWDNQEVLNLIKWMRAYNVTRGNRPELRFVGSDMQDDPVVIRDMILQFIKATSPEHLDLTSQRLSCLSAQRETSASCLAAVAAVDEVVKEEVKTTRLVPPEDALRAEHAAMVALEIAQMRSDSNIIDQTNSRDRSMASNVEWFATAMFPHARIAVWAHDGHVMTSSTYGMIPMGTYLRAHYGAGYYVIGFAFDRGSVSPNGISPPVTIAPAPPQAVGAILSSAHEPLFGLNLRSISAQTALGAYLSSEQPMRTLGSFSSASDLNPSQSFGYVNLKRSFDSLIFVKTMHPAHAFELQRRQLARSIALPVGAGGITWPTKWLLVGSDPSQYNTGGDAPSSTYPSGLLWLSSVSGLGNGVTVGTVPVAAYLGKQVQLSGELRAFQVGEGASAWLRVDGANKPVSFDNMANRMLQGTTTWIPFSITLNVPADARDIAFGLLLRGQGWLWATNLQVKSIDRPSP